MPLSSIDRHLGQEASPHIHRFRRIGRGCYLIAMKLWSVSVASTHRDDSAARDIHDPFCSILLPDLKRAIDFVHGEISHTCDLQMLDIEPAACFTAEI